MLPHGIEFLRDRIRRDALGVFYAVVSSPARCTPPPKAEDDQRRRAALRAALDAQAAAEAELAEARAQQATFAPAERAERQAS